MKHFVFTGFFLVTGLMGEAMAACPSSGATQVTTNLNATLSGNTVCGLVGNEAWQEYHASNGDVIDYKQGPGDAVDPSETVGTWTIATDNVSYNYGTGGTYAYSVWQRTDGLYDFCGARDVTGVALKAGQVKC